MSSADIEAVKDLVQSVIVDRTEHYIPTRYPWTYSADFIRQHPTIVPEDIRRALVRIDARSDAAGALRMWAKALGVDRRELASVFADGYLQEAGIPLGIANTERLAHPGGSDG